MKILMFFIFFLLIGGFFIISNDNLKISGSEDMNQFFKLYGEWLDGLVSNTGIVAGNVVKMEWLPEHYSEDK